MGTKSNSNAIIVGIDFGTTYSGVAWAFSGGPEKIQIVKKWPGNRQYAEKVPTLLSYMTGGNAASGVSGYKYKWGFEVKSESSTKLSWFKLLLNQQPTSSSDRVNHIRPGWYIGTPSGDDQLQDLRDTVANIPKDKELVDVVSDYLRSLHNHLMVTLHKSYPPTFTRGFGNETNFKYNLTVPAIWTDKARALTLEAAKTAGIGVGRDEIRLISEPEAAAIHYLKSFHETENCLSVGDVFIIVDCGGGTVDLISYQIEAVTPRLSLKEVVPGSGGLCGAASLNRRFEDLVKDRIGNGAYQQMSPQARANTLGYFEDYLKKTYLPSEYQEFEDDNDREDAERYYCPVPQVENGCHNGNQGGILVLTSEDMKSIFRPSLEEITRLVQSQVDMAEARCKRAIAGILLVGGYGSSEYLQRYLEERVKSNQTTKPVKILQSANAWAAVVCGAVLDGLNTHNHNNLNTRPQNMVQCRIARYSYGVASSEPFKEGVHPLHKMYYDNRFGQLMCRDRMSWFVVKGQELPHGQPIRVNLSKTVALEAPRDEFKITQVVHFSDADIPPSDKEDPGVQILFQYEADLYDVPRSVFTQEKSPLNEVFWSIPIDMVMHYDSQLVFSTEIRSSKSGEPPIVIGKSPKILYDYDSSLPTA